MSSHFRGSYYPLGNDEHQYISWCNQQQNPFTDQYTNHYVIQNTNQYPSQCISSFAESSSLEATPQVQDQPKWIRGRGIINHFAGGTWCPKSECIMEVDFLSGHRDATVIYPGTLVSKLYDVNFIHEDTVGNLNLEYRHVNESFPKAVLTPKGPLKPIGRCRLFARLPDVQPTEWRILDFYVLKGAPTNAEYMFILGKSGYEQLLGKDFDFQEYNKNVPSRLEAVRRENQDLEARQWRR